MKSKFAKFTDYTLGAALVFFAATAILRYYTTLELAAFSATAITACAIFILSITGKRKTEKQSLSTAAEAMFFDFLFADDGAPTRLLYKGLKARDNRAVMHGNGVYLNETAAFCLFDAPLDDKTSARLISKAKHFGAKKAVVFCKSPPTAIVDVNDFSLKAVHGDNVYKLFASLNCLPEKRFSTKKKSRLAAFSGALGGDKIIKYLLLSAIFFAFATFTYSLITFVCACVCAVLFVVSAVLSVIKSVKTKR